MGRPRAKDDVRKAREDIYRRSILAAGERVFGERGYEATKIQDIATAAELSVGTIYGLFPGKDALFRAIHETRAAEMLQRLADEVPADASSRDGLLASVAVYIGYFVDHPSYLRMHLHERTAWAYPELTTDVQMTTWERGLRRMADAFRRGIEAGEFVDESPQMCARMMLAANQVHMAEWVSGGMTAPREEVIARMQRFVERAFFRAR